MVLGERIRNELFVVLFVGLIAISVLSGYWKLVVLQDFVTFTSEGDLPEYVISTEESALEE